MVVKDIVRAFILIVFCLLDVSCIGQSTEKLYPTAVIGSDTIIQVSIPAAVITTEETAQNRSRRWRRNARLKKKVVKVYPYACAAGQIMQEVEAELETIEGTKEKKAFLKEAESKLKTQFEGELRALTVSEGVILIKLIDRETGDCSYELIQELKGNFNAFMWQSVARLFGHNLKDEYDPEGKDRAIEQIVQDIKQGSIPISELSMREP